MAALGKHNMWYSALGVRWKNSMGVSLHMGILPRRTLHTAWLSALIKLV